MKFNRSIFLAALLLGSVCGSHAQKATHSFTIQDGNFQYDGKPVQIHAGEMHYARIPHQYWRHRLQMIKAMGLNTVATYVFWNFHEEQEGKWDFEGDHDLAKFIQTAQEEGLMVILRPGPYACAEWEFGGYPWWLQKVDGLEIRRDNAPFLAYTAKYLNRLAKEIGHLQITQGGPIIMVQAENEFGSYVSQRKDIPLEEHKAYNAKIKKQLEDAGFQVPLFTSDGTWLFEGGATAGALPTANGEDNIENLKKAVNQYHGGQGPYMVAEFYPGWLSHWAEPFPKVSAEKIATQTELYLQNQVSFNYYMVHGGTNFGFTSGANYNKQHHIQPDLTSYDYDAPVSEAGWATPKYHAIREVMLKHVAYQVPEVPAALPVIEIPSIKLNKVVNVLDAVATLPGKEADQPLTFEQLDHPFGYVVYSRQFNQPIQGTLSIEGLRDYAMVYVDGEPVGELNRYFNNYALDIDVPFNSTLQIVVENMGRINYGAEIVHNNKGLITPVHINDIEITGSWVSTALPINHAEEVENLLKSAKTANFNKISALKDMPLLYSGEFELTDVGDTFLDMEAWGKGIVYINGRNIGRYWKVGPQQTLFIPGVYLRKGKNSLAIFEQANRGSQTTVHTVKQPVLDKLAL
ncbi:beta-galactosidase [Sphingobacterium oryzagri]|uniref:Beta-galactosidase n=1 Tax=Sphingobacterium oryzagri TaxID=3025669 RepID=A0ABY7WGF2_9SPHI|nr:beta-galactosidase family protein [Sphingobacterium sp. KACC 22765]WDF67587.1 beta-galactosidase [Sphingobacterium sp. KACC 22765]